MAEGEKIASGYVEIVGDTTALDDTMKTLQGRLTAQVRRLQAEMARNKLKMRTADTPEALAALSQANTTLAAKIGLIQSAAQKQGVALTQVAAAARDATQANRQFAASAVDLNARVAQIQRGTEGPRLTDPAQRIQAQIARNKLALKSVLGASSRDPYHQLQLTSLDLLGEQGGGGAAARLIQENADLVKKLRLVEAAARKKGAALSEGTGITIAASQATRRFAAGSMVVHTGMKEVQNSAKGAGMGLLMLGQMIDDAQYGFRSIVNNIPGVVMSLGGSAGLAGAVAIAGVGINTWINHWEDAKEAFGDLSFIQNAANAISDFGHQVAETVGVPDLFAIGAEQKKIKARNAEGKKAIASVEDIAGEGAEAHGQAITAAIKAFGGGKDVLNALEDRQRRAGAPEAGRDVRRMNNSRIIEEARKGNLASIESLTRALPDLGPVYERHTPQGRAEADAARQEAAYAGEQSARREREHAQAVTRRADELARGLEGRAGNALLKSPKFGLNNFVREQIQDIVPVEDLSRITMEVAQRIRAKTESEVEKRRLEKGISPEAARSEVLRDHEIAAREKAEAERRKVMGDVRQSERLSADAFLGRIQTAALKPRDMTQQEMLKATKQSVGFLRDIAHAVKPRPMTGGAKFG